MTDPSMALMNYLRNLGTDVDADFLRQSIDLRALLVMEVTLNRVKQKETHRRNYTT